MSRAYRRRLAAAAPLICSWQPSASFLGTDTATKGAWNGVYGGAGYILAEPTTSGTASLPSGLSWSISAHNFFDYGSGGYTVPAAAPQLPSSSSQYYTVWYSGPPNPQNFTVTLTESTPKAYALAVYLVDADNAGRTATVQLTDLSGKALTSAIAASSYDNGIYLKFRFINSVKVVFTNTTGGGSVANVETPAIFLDTTT